jgi:Abnormal spindle-like microcephaly-assoc'd, ASPM-SPD-2-Hydin
MRVLPVVVLCLIVSACSNSQLQGVEPARLIVSPAQLTFSPTFVGNRASAALEITNVGGSATELQPRSEPPFNIEPLTLRLARGETQTLTIDFAPTSAGHFEGTLHIGELEVLVSGDATVVPTCDAPSSCLEARFDEAAGQCVTTAKPDGTTCASACLSTGTCMSGTCIGQVLSCDDANPCTLDACDESSGCIHTTPGCAAPTNPCQVARCDATLGCVLSDALDGTSCGDDDCATPDAEVCVSGQCLRRPRPTSARCTNTWVPLNISGGFHPAMAFDEQRQRLVAVSSGQTWEWNGTRWTHRGIAPLQLEVMTWDSVRARLVAVGGSLDEVTLKTWEWDGNQWAERVTAVAPPARTRTALAFDARRQRVVLFGGSPASNLITPFDDTWEFDGQNWFRRTSLHAPAARSSHALAWDARRSTVVLFGGNASVSTPPFLGDTWEWDGTDWRAANAGASPGARTHHAMAWDERRQRVVLFSGYLTSSGAQADTWEWDGLSWMPMVSRVAPSPRLGHVMAWDGASQTVALFGGERLSDLWEWDGESWRERTSATTPWQQQKYGTVTFDRMRSVFVGVFTSPTSTPETWEWAGGTAPWVERVAPGFAGELTWDDARHRVVLVGQRAASLEVAEWDGQVWTTTNPATKPVRRDGFGLTFDAARGRVVLFGGFVSRGGRVSEAVALSDTWEWDGQDWALQPTPPALTPRGDVGITYSDAAQRVVMFGGGVVWERAGTSWTQLSPTLSPPARAGPRLAFDASRATVVMFGGSWFSDTWEWSQGVWSQRQPRNSPPSAAALVYDSSRQRMVAFANDGTSWFFAP